jgi:hypothetical protein
VGESTTLCSHKRIGKARKQNIKASFKPITGTCIYRLFNSTENADGRTVCYLPLALPLAFVMTYVHMYGLWTSSPLPVWQGQKQEFAHRFVGRKSGISILPPMREKMDVLVARGDLQFNVGSKPQWGSAVSDSITSYVIGEGMARRINSQHRMRPVSKPGPSAWKAKALLLHQQISQTHLMPLLLRISHIW